MAASARPGCTRQAGEEPARRGFALEDTGQLKAERDRGGHVRAAAGGMVFPAGVAGELDGGDGGVDADSELRATAAVAVSAVAIRGSGRVVAVELRRFYV